jgi:hypothetical protein
MSQGVYLSTLIMNAAGSFETSAPDCKDTASQTVVLQDFSFVLVLQPVHCVLSPAGSKIFTDAFTGRGEMLMVLADSI